MVCICSLSYLLSKQVWNEEDWNDDEPDNPVKGIAQGTAAREAPVK